MMVSTWSIGGKTVHSLVINNKEVQSIVRNSDSKVLYEKDLAHGYSIAFGQSSYTATGGTCTISCTLLYDGSPVNGEVVTVTGDNGLFYESVTNLDGVAVFNLIDLTTTITCTCTYSNVSATCTVIVQSNPVMNYNLTSYNVTCDSTIDPGYLIIVCVTVSLLEEYEWMTGHTLNDLNNATNIDVYDIVQLFEDNSLPVPVLWDTAPSEYVSDFSELVDGLDIVPLDIDTGYPDNLLLLYSFLQDFDTGYTPLKVEYTATDSNNLQAFVTNEIIQ